MPIHRALEPKPLEVAQRTLPCDPKLAVTDEIALRPLELCAQLAIHPAKRRETREGRSAEFSCSP